MENSESELLESCRIAAQAARQKSKLPDESGQVISLDDHATEVWVRFQKQVAREIEKGTPIENEAAMLRKIASNVLNDGFRRLERFRKTQEEFEIVAETSYVPRDSGAAERRQRNSAYCWSSSARANG
jgi:DNA-directed RNA polymerase specialized sigma24 family protein